MPVERRSKPNPSTGLLFQMGPSRLVKELELPKSERWSRPVRSQRAFGQAKKRCSALRRLEFGTNPTVANPGSRRTSRPQTPVGVRPPTRLQYSSLAVAEEEWQ